MKKRTRKQTADIVMGILLQILFFFPWMICDGKRYTIHGYLLKVLLNNDYVETYDTFFYPGVQGIAEYTRPIATGFLLVMIGLVTVQVVELVHLYLSWRGEKFPQIQGAIWVLGMIATSVIGDLAYSEKTMETYLTRGVYIYAFSFLIIEGLWIFMGKWTELWDSQETEHKMQIRKKEQEVLDLKVEILEARYQGMLKSRKVVHDMKNHLLALKKYDQERDWEGLHEYLDELSNEVLESDFSIWTGNKMLDMILNQKKKEAKEQGISMQIQTEVFTKLPFSDREIVSLFGNLLDNALEACEKITDEERWIHVKMIKRNSLLYISVENSVVASPLNESGEMVSGKKEPALHGYGLQNIWDIVEKYEGDFNCKEDQEHFVASISIYDTEYDAEGGG